MSYKFLLLCIVSFVSNGLISVAVKAHQISENPAPEIDFLILASFIIFVIAFLLIVLIVLKKGNLPKDIPEPENGLKTLGKAFFSGVGKSFSISVLLLMLCRAVCYAVANGIGNILSMMAAKKLDSSIQFPIISSGVLTLTAMLSWLVFKERLEKYDISSIFLAVVGIVLFRH